MSNNKLGSFVTRLFGIRFKKGANTWNPTVRSSSTDVHWLLETVSAILLLGAINKYTPQPESKLEKLGAFLRKFQPPPPQRMTGEIDPPPAGTTTEFVIILSNLGCDDLDLTESIAAIKELNFYDENNEALIAEPYLESRTFDSKELVTLLEFREKLGDCDLLNQRTLVALNNKMQDSAMKALLASCDATDFGDFTGPSQTDPADPLAKAWTKGLVSRLTTGGPNGSMAGQIAVDYVDTVTTPSFYLAHRKIDTFAALDMSDPVVAIVQDAVDSAAQSTAKGLTAYLSKVSQSRDDTDADRQTATMVKGIKDSMSSTGKTVAQLAVFNALGNDLITELPKEEQLQVAYTVANTTRAAVEATGNHIADLYQANEIPTDEELKAIGALGLGDFLSSVATTVANGVMQAAPVILNSVANSITASNSLSSKLPPSVMLTFLDSVKELPPAAKITLASRIVNGVTNPDANVVTDKAVIDLAARTSQLGAQATLDTFINTPVPEMDKNDPEHRKKFRQVALAVSTLSPTLSNVTDIGATNLVTDAILAHSDSLRQNALEVGIRASANIIADNPTETMLFKVHQHRLKTGRDVNPRIFGFLLSAVPIAAKIASTVIPALLGAI